MNIDDHIRNWANHTLRESIELGEIDETNYPCTDGFPQAEKDICTCPDCGEKMYENVNRNAAYDHFVDIFSDNDEITVTQEDDAVYISFDASGYDSDAYAELGFENIKKMVQDEIEEINKYDHGNFSVEEDKEPYTLKITGDSYVDEEKDIINEENLTDEQKTLKEYFDQAKEEGGELKVHYIKATNGEERTAIFSTSANVGASFNTSKKSSEKKLKTITKDHDRVYSQNVEYTGGLVTFPELITDETPHVTNTKDAEDGTKWQWRKLYIENILDVSYNGEIVWENKNPSSNLAGHSGEVRTTVSKAEFDKEKESYEKYQREQDRKNAEYKVMRRKAVDLAKTMSEEDCSVDVGYADANGFEYLTTENKIKVMALRIKHDELCRTNPSKHEMVDTSRNPTRGDHSMKCKGCNYSVSWDSSD